SIRVFLYRSRAPRHPPSFPTRRSSDLLAAHPAHSRARELFDGFSAMLSFEVKGGLEAAERFIQRARLPIVAPSLGGIETLITRRSEEHTSELQSPDHLVCRLLLDKKKK